MRPNSSDLQVRRDHTKANFSVLKTKSSSSLYTFMLISDVTNVRWVLSQVPQSMAHDEPCCGPPRIKWLTINNQPPVVVIIFMKILMIWSLQCVPPRIKWLTINNHPSPCHHFHQHFDDLIIMEMCYAEDQMNNNQQPPLSSFSLTDLHF